jgi:hypothetical protein
MSKYYRKFNPQAKVAVYSSRDKHGRRCLLIVVGNL